MKYGDQVKWISRIGWCVVGTVALGWGCVVGCAERHESPAVFNDQAVTSKPTTETHELGSVEVREDKYPDDKIQRRSHGVVDADGNFILHGLVTNYWENGRKKSEENYVYGVRQGLRRAWYQDGQPWSLGEYDTDGKEDGVWIVWFPNGRKSSETHFNHGDYGAHTEWYSNGKKKLQYTYVHGKLQGPYTKWDETGDIMSRVEYVDGVVQP